MKLRGYQNEIIVNIKKSIHKGNKNVVIVASCGSGKTVTYSSMINSATKKKNQVLFLVHRKELIEQTRDTLIKFDVEMDYVELYMVQTACRRLGKIKEPKLIICDEAHHICSDSYLKILDYFNNTIVLGFTATPIRLNEGGLGKVFTDMIESVSVKWLIHNKYLSDYKYYGIKLVDFDSVKLTAGEFNKSEVNELMNTKNIYGDAIEHWERLAINKKTIIYCSGIDSSLNIVKSFQEKGYEAEHIDGKTNKKEREEIIDKFRNGEIKLLSNVDLLGEGFDVPDCECVILLRPTMSMSLHIQQSMRSMRYKENKTAIIIDHVGNVYRHGLPSMEQNWTLEVKKKKNKKGEAPVVQCDECYITFPANMRECPECGWEREITRKEKEIIEAELEQITESYFKSMEYSGYKNIKTFEDMCRFQKSKKYKFGWVIRKCAEQGIPIPSKYAYMARFHGVII